MLIGQESIHRHFQLVNRKCLRNLLLEERKAYLTNESINKSKLMQMKFKQEIRFRYKQVAKLSSTGHFVLVLKL